MSISRVVMMTLDVVETVSTVCSCRWHDLGEVGEVYSVLAFFASGNDGQEVVAPHNLLRNKGGSDLTGRASGLCSAIKEDDQLKLLLVERVYCHLKERTTLVNDVVECEGTYKEKVVLTSIYHEINVHLVHDDGLTIWCVCGPQQLAIDLAPNHQGFTKVGHSD